ncbi:hypothetical protein [Blastococcus sp. TF02A-35]|uniref:hypothetical protein n=1 Tax=Blastococcus sp. TF02A-35 TaxID=2559612 RepID=UPI00107313BA|nr:hypothetical protein [Blastococcus sp. TF02A_35]TFV43755.1 hypothetical protein E4P43_19460 [Blastococcus sp. TF02A_35]
MSSRRKPRKNRNSLHSTPRNAAAHADRVYMEPVRMTIEGEGYDVEFDIATALYAIGSGRDCCTSR